MASGQGLRREWRIKRSSSFRMCSEADLLRGNKTDMGHLPDRYPTQAHHNIYSRHSPQRRSTESAQHMSRPRKRRVVNLKWQTAASHPTRLGNNAVHCGLVGQRLPQQQCPQQCRRDCPGARTSGAAGERRTARSFNSGPNLFLVHQSIDLSIVSTKPSYRWTPSNTADDVLRSSIPHLSAQ